MKINDFKYKLSIENNIKLESKNFQGITIKYQIDTMDFKYDIYLEIKKIMFKVSFLLFLKNTITHCGKS